MAWAVDLTNLKSLFTDSAWRNLTDGGQNSIGTIAINQAKSLTYAKFKKANLHEDDDFTDASGDFDYDTVGIALPTLYFAQYYLYSRVENEELAKDKRQDGEELLSTLISAYAYDMVPNNKEGGNVMPGGSGSGKTLNYAPVIYVEEGTDTYNGFGGFE